MNIKNAARRSAVVIAILLLSILIGYIYQLIGNKVDIKNHPREYSEFVEKYSAEYGVPEYILYAVIKNGSGFQSNHVSDDGRIGLMQITPECFSWLLTLTKESHNDGILYDPETNIRYGAYMMSFLYTQYSRWKTVIAICVTDEKTVQKWCENPENTDDNGNLTFIPDENVRRKVDNIQETADIYQKLYY